MDPRQFRRLIAEACETTRTHYGRWQEGARGNTLARSPLPLDDLPERFGVYPVSPGGGTTRVGVLDFDNHGGGLAWEAVVERARPVFEHLRALGHHPMPFRSTGGLGLHVWLLWDRAQSAAAVRELLAEAAEVGGLAVGGGGLAVGEVEVFPKQATVPKDGWGSCVDPPLAGRSCPLDPATLAPTDEVPVPVTSRPLDPKATPPPDRRGGPSWHEETVRSALAAVPADDYDVWVTVLRALRGGAALASVDARALAEEWSRTSPKHDARSFDQKWERGFPKERAGKGRSLGTLYWLAAKRFGWERPSPPCCVGRIRIQDSEPKLYLVTIVGYEEKEIPMRSADLNSKVAFVNRVTEAIDHIVRPPKPEDLNRLLGEAERIEADDAATTLGQFRGHLLRYLDETLSQHREELRFAHRTWHDPAADRSWFKWPDLDGWLRRQRHYDVKHTEAFHMVRLLRGGKGTVDLGKYGKQAAWWVPLDPREHVPEPSARTVPDESRTPF